MAEHSYLLPEYPGQLDKKSSSLLRPGSGPQPQSGGPWNVLGGGPAGPSNGGIRKAQSRHFDAFNEADFAKDFANPWGAGDMNKPTNGGRSVSGPGGGASLGPSGQVQPILQPSSHVTTPDHNHHTNGSGSADDELIPTAIVIKNIPFAIKKEQLLEVMTSLGLPLPYAFNYHFDNGVFRGLAFANFTTPEETATVINNLNSREIGGRKLRVEYKKMLPLAERERIEREKRERRGQLEEQHRSKSHKPLPPHHVAPNGTAGQPPMPVGPPPAGPTGPKVDLNDPETLEFYSQLLLFRDDKNRQELVFPNTLLPHQRRIVVVFSNQLGLVFSGQDKSGSLIVLKQSTPQPPPPGLFDHVVHQPQPQYPQGVFPVQNFGQQAGGHQLSGGQQPILQPSQQPLPHQHQQVTASAAAAAHQPTYTLRGTRSFADIRNQTSYPYNISAPGTPTGFPPLQTPVQPVQHQPHSSQSVHSGAQAIQPGLRGFPYFSQPQLGHGLGAIPGQQQQQQQSVAGTGQLGYPPHELNSLSDSFSSLMSLGGMPISRAPSANKGSVGSTSPTTSVTSVQESAGVIGSKHGVIDVNTIVNDSNESTA